MLGFFCLFVCLVGLILFVWGQGGGGKGGQESKKAKIGPSTHFLEEALKQLVVKAWLVA